METFKDLYKFLQTHTGDGIISWLEVPWEGKDKQESLLRLFAGLGLISKLSEFNIYKGNFNLNQITPMTSKKDIFYNDKNKLIRLKDKGDSSDLTGMYKKQLLVTTSKNLNTNNIGKMDIDKILTNFKQYEKDCEMVLCVAIRYKEIFDNMVKNIEKTNKELKTILIRDSTIVIDWNDLNEAFYNFKKLYQDIDIKLILDSKKKALILKMHQQLGVNKTINLKNTNQLSVLWGHIQRSGKSYIIAGTIIEDSKNKKKSNYLIITTAPNETIEQYTNVMDCSQLEGFNIILLNGTNKKPEIKDKNVIICSKQFLQGKTDITKNIAWLKAIEFDARFLDESHNGGSTELAKKTLQTYGSGSFTVQITATYSKPANNYDIPRKNWILWDLEDIVLCKTLTNDNTKRLIKKHGLEIETIIKQYAPNSIKEEYNKYPELWILTHKIDPKIIKETNGSMYGWSTDACFLLNEGSNVFQNENENLKMWKTIFGERNSLGIPDKDFHDKIVFMSRVKEICKNQGSRHIDNYKEPMIIMAFLPQNNIDNISNATKELLERHDIAKDYIICIINSKACGSNSKQEIENSRIQAKNNNKKGVLVLSGKQCSLGVSIENCDIVILLNNNSSYDILQQMMFRGMTEGTDKKCGFVIDMNIHRVVDIAVDYAIQMNPEKTTKEAIKSVLMERLICINGDHWLPSFGKNITRIEDISDDISDIFNSNITKAIENRMAKLDNIVFDLKDSDQNDINEMFEKWKSEKNSNNVTEEEEINKGIEKESDKPANNESNDDSTKSTDSEEVNVVHVNFMEVLRHMIPFVCIVTIHNNSITLINMFKDIQEEKELFELLESQSERWCEKIDIKKFVALYTEYMSKHRELNNIIRTVKELFILSKNNKEELSKLIDKYLIPSINEKKYLAEISTPYEIRKEMLDKIPSKFWKKPRKVFEPCSGKGGFLIDIVNRFMDGLIDYCPNIKKRYKLIVEECLYFSDINCLNIYINQLLLNPNNKYCLNYNQGNTLTLNISKKWGLSGFSAIIGNPPYQAENSTGTGTPIWNDFVRFSLSDQMLKENGFLVFVHPAGWRKDTKSGNFKNLYSLMTQKNYMTYLEIHSSKDGLKNFKCGTRYDFYVINKSNKNGKTIIKNEKGIIETVNLKNTYFCPNFQIKYILEKLIDNKNHLEVQRNCNYHSTTSMKKNIIKNTENKTYKYPVIHSITKNDIKYKYANDNSKDSFGIPKLIFSDNNSFNIIVDKKGKYGTTEHVLYIEIEDNNYMNIKNAMESNKFKELINATILSNYQLDYKILSLLKKDFWKEFI
jgi:hypothetical protein